MKECSKVKKLCPLEVLGVDFVLNMAYEAELKKIQTQEKEPLQRIEKTAKKPFCF